MDFLLPEIAVAEKILRSMIVYGFLLVAFRMAGKRLLGQLTAFDLVVLLIISNVLQSSAMSEVRYAILEEDGHVSVIPRRSVPA
jgi:uncharacterized membrane protein YcaP (DUF421 family)